jgi:hypothetical protein
MRRKQTSCLETALSSLKDNPVTWTPPAPTPLDDDDYDVLAQQSFRIVLEQGGTDLNDVPSGMARALVRGMIEEQDLQNELTPMPDALYSTKWARVSDEVFAQYAPLAQRRLDPRGTGMPVQSVEPVEGNPCPVCEYPRGTDPVCEQCWTECGE